MYLLVLSEQGLLGLLAFTALLLGLMIRLAGGVAALRAAGSARAKVGRTARLVGGGARGADVGHGQLRLRRHRRADDRAPVLVLGLVAWAVQPAPPDGTAS